ncbi:unnamed protein product [Penicillium glandicola]
MIVSILEKTDTPQMAHGNYLKQPFSGLPCHLDANSQQLWHHFVHAGSATMSCHKQMQNQTCRVLLPMAFEAPALCHAIIYFSAAYKAAQIEDQGQRDILIRHAASLRTASLSYLRQDILSVESRRPEPIFATCLMLCLSALCHDNKDYSTWRTHLLGARAMLPLVHDVTTSASDPDSSTIFLQRRYDLLETIASLTFSGLQPLVLNDRPLDKIPQPTQVKFDDYCGCYTDVLGILRHIGAISWGSWEQEHEVAGSAALPEADYELEAVQLEAKVLAMIERDSDTRPTFDLAFQNTFDEKQTLEFAYCNLLCEYAALIHIRTQMRGLESDSADVQHPVKMIISIAQQLEPPSGLSPVLGINTALFLAGRHALHTDRTAIRQLILCLYNKIHSQNLVHTLRILDYFWEQFDSRENYNEVQQIMPVRDFIAW